MSVTFTVTMIMILNVTVTMAVTITMIMNVTVTINSTIIMIMIMNVTDPDHSNGYDHDYGNVYGNCHV